MVNTSIGTLFKVRSGDGIAVASLSSYGKYPVYGGNGIAGYTNRYNTESGTMIIGRVGEKCGNVNISASRCWVSDNALKVTPLVKYNQNYMMYLMEHTNLNSYANRNAQPVVSGQIIYAIEVPYCTDIEEQVVIAGMLTDFDSHIANLAELIEKKKAIRDGALENLVSGKTRLAGYADEWSKTTIGACAEVFQGGTPSTTNSRFWGGNVIWVTPSEITKLPTMYIDDSERKITEEGVQNSSARLLPAGTILLCTRATIGDLAIARKPMTTNQGFKNLVCNADVHNVFFAYLLRTLKPVMLSLAIGTTFLEVSKRNLSSIEISMPNYPEQKAIAEVLMAMDKEIKDLEDERDKMIQIREGAMDDLLTGRVRLTV